MRSALCPPNAPSTRLDVEARSVGLTSSSGGRPLARAQSGPSYAAAPRELVNCVCSVASPLLANVYLHYVFDLWVRQWRGRHATGDVIVVRYADDLVVGFEHRDDAEQFLTALRERFAKFGLELHADKTRLIEFGRNVAAARAERGVERPETFDFLGLTHVCGKSRKGRFQLQRRTMSKRMRAKLSEVNAELQRRRHRPIREQGEWLASVIRGHCAYYAVPTNARSVQRFRTAVVRHWRRALKKCGQKHRLRWQRMNLLVSRWLPPARIAHPWPDARFDVRTRGKSPVR